MSWWRRAVLAVLDSERGFAAVVIAMGCVFIAPVFIFGGWWMGGICVVGLSFLGGYAFARREWRRKGYVPKL